jgi:hypothetical protein
VKEISTVRMDSNRMAIGITVTPRNRDGQIEKCSGTESAMVMLREMDIFRNHMYDPIQKTTPVKALVTSMIRAGERVPD